MSCENNGTCVELGISVACGCPPGFTGIYCEQGNYWSSSVGCYYLFQYHLHVLKKTATIPFFKSYVVTLSCTCIKITASILVVTAFYKIIHMYWYYKLYKFCENKFEVDKNHILYRGCLFSEVNECNLDPCPENFTCNNIVGSFDCLYCNASSDNCTAGMLQFCYNGWLHCQNTKQSNNKNNPTCSCTCTTWHGNVDLKF